MYPKVLVISHNVFNNTTSMGRTLSNFFTQWPSECLAQLYFHSEIPDEHSCSNYFRITDLDMLKKKQNDIGVIFNINSMMDGKKVKHNIEDKQKKLYMIGKKRMPYIYICRNFIWKKKKWYSDKLKQWINSFDPDIIFFAAGDYIFSYRIAMQIAQDQKIPILTYVCDDYYFFRPKSISFFALLNTHQYRHMLKDFFKKYKSIVSICDDLSQAYIKEFDVNATTIMTSSLCNQKYNRSQKTQNGITISFIGNLGYNRDASLIDIGEALYEITEGEIAIQVYSFLTRSSILHRISNAKGITFRGAISGEQVNKVINNSDILIHVESMDKINRKKVKYSISTKIADSLASGKCLFAYGPEEIASINYLKKNQCACVVTNKNQLKDKLKQLIYDVDLRNFYGKKAQKVANQNHSEMINCQKIYEIITESLKGK